MYGDETRSRDIFGSYGGLPVARAAVLKHTLRSIHRMMQSSGTSEGLRGLIDSTLLQSIKKIMEYRGLFGPSVLPLGESFAHVNKNQKLMMLSAMNIMATFVHNEPTSLPTIQEAGLPQVFYQAIETGVEPVIEVGCVRAVTFLLFHKQFSRSFKLSQTPLVLYASTKMGKTSSQPGPA
jgi:E3 ubiquitin-protein ligase HUWE1